MKKFIGVFLAIILIISQSTLVFADKNGANLNLKCKSAVLMDVTSGKVLYEKNCHEKLPPASVTKVMTMLLICEAVESNKIKLTDEVTVSETASSMGGSQIFLEPNETQTVDTLLKGIAVASANDACVAMAEYIGGSIEGFVDMMNNKAKELGMKDTNFVNTNGLPVDNHYTSAYDIALMSRELLKHEMIEKYLTTWMDKVVVGKKQATIGLANTNKMIKYYNGATGVKTGFTGEAKYCVSASAKRGKTHLVSVVLRGETSQERFKDASTLLDYGFANYESVKICSKDQKLYTLKMRKADSEQIDLVAKDDLGILIKKGESKNFTKKIKVNEDIKLPVKKGSVLGKAMIYQDGKLIDEVELVNNKDIEKARVQVSYIVGRDTTHLDEGEIIRATVETVAENTVDGIIAPMFYAFIGGAPLAMAYKAINTLDSTVGYKNDKYKDMGFASAKIDDIANFIPARISSILMAIGSFILKYNYKDALKISIRDRKNHKSPNCAYPEGAVAGALGIQLGGTNIYFGKAVYKPTIGDKHREIEVDDIVKTNKIMYATSITSIVVFTIIFKFLY